MAGKELADEGLSTERSVGTGKPQDVSAVTIPMEGVPMRGQGFGGIDREKIARGKQMKPRQIQRLVSKFW